MGKKTVMFVHLMVRQDIIKWMMRMIIIQQDKGEITCGYQGLWIN